jgi:low affinity Fe/Cu permease
MTNPTAMEAKATASAADHHDSEQAHTSKHNHPGGTKAGQWFRRFSHAASHYLGSPIAFALALLLVVVWAAAGPFYGYSDSWGLVINTVTTIITFLMVFLIQNTQNRDALAIQLKLDELLRALQGARTSLVDLESLSDEQMEHLKNEFARLAHERGHD